MKKIIYSITLLLFSVTLKAQSDSSFVYYKDFTKLHKIEKEKAKYVEKTIKFDNDSISIKFYNTKSGELVTLQNYKNGEPSGVWLTYDKKGNLIDKMDYSKLFYSTKKIEGGYYFNIDQEESLDFTPAYYKTKKEYYTFLGVNGKYPSYAKDNNIQGTVKLHVKINKNGELEVISIYEGVSPDLDMEAIRVYEMMPPWTPSIKNGEPIDSYTIVLYKFVLM